VTERTVPALSARGLTKAYGHVEALRGADLECRRGEVTALIGDNGAGKSTLVKIISGAIAPDGGQIRVDGKPYRADSPAAAQAAGIETVYQDLALAPDLGPAQNLFLGRERRRRGLLGTLGFLDDRAMRDAAAREFERLGVSVDPRRRSVRALSGGQQQGVAVARAASWAKSIVVFDEPTAALGVVQTHGVLDMIRQVADQGMAVVFVSHNMPDVLSVADRIEVLRLGTKVATFHRDEASVELLVSAMTGGFSNVDASTRDGEVPA
jgi:simple sugar transport system ATP-binding protein